MAQTETYYWIPSDDIKPLFPKINVAGFEIPGLLADKGNAPDWDTRIRFILNTESFERLQLGTDCLQKTIIYFRKFQLDKCVLNTSASLLMKLHSHELIYGNAVVCKVENVKY